MSDDGQSRARQVGDYEYRFDIGYFETIADSETPSGRRDLFYGKVLCYSSREEADAARGRMASHTGWLPRGAHSAQVGEVYRIARRRKDGASSANGRTTAPPSQ